MTDKPQTHNGDLANLPAALAPLTEHDHWVVWRWESRPAKGANTNWTKPPYEAENPGRNAKSNDPSTWGRYADAVAAVTAGAADGIGFMLKDSAIGAVDVDHCVDGENLVPWAERLHTEADGAYQEVTVSGGGLRIIGKASGPELHRKFTFDRKSGAGIELYRNTARYITVSGLEIGSCPELPPLDDLIDTLFARHSGQAGGLDFNDAKLQGLDYDDLIRNGAPEGSRSESFSATVWHLAGKGWSVEQITDELARHPNGIGAKYAHRLHEEVSRSYSKWQARKRAAVTGGAAPAASNDSWPQIYVRPGELPRVVNEAEEALLLLGREIYQRGGMLVRPVLSRLKASDDRSMESWRLIPLTSPYLVETLTCAGRFLRYDARSKDWAPIDAPDDVADTYLSRVGEWKLPVLTGIAHTPFLRSDGSVCETPGYDEASGIFFKPDGVIFPPIPLEPTQDDAWAALALIENLIATFPFVTKADKAVALSAILTTLDRRAMATAPLHAFTAPSAGTGKSLLVDIAAMLATGRPMPVIAPGRGEEELEKRLGAALLAGDAGISLDNCEHPLQSTFLCQALTQLKLNIRVLGLSKNVETPVAATIFATGNNLTIAGDLTRRSLLCSLDAQDEHPERRCFEVDPLDVAQTNRARLVVAALTILRAWLVSGESVTRSPLGSFEDWSYRIRAPLLWLGCGDPCETTLKVQDGDPKRLALETVIAQWKEHIGVRKIEENEQKAQNVKTIQEVINRAVNENEFHVALLNVAAGRTDGAVSNDRLGRWLKKVENQVVSVRIPGTEKTLKLAFRREGERKGGYPLWALVEVP